MADLKFRFGLIKRSNNQAVPEDEPIFILRARDRLALSTLRYYMDLSERDGCNDFHMNTMIAACEEFEDWQHENPDKMKQPGVTRGR